MESIPVWTGFELRASVEWRFGTSGRWMCDVRFGTRSTWHPTAAEIAIDQSQ